MKNKLEWNHEGLLATYNQQKMIQAKALAIEMDKFTHILYL